jgi:PAS domain S-box-containing protein
MRWWPRSIRWQMLAGLLILEVFSVSLFAALLTEQQGHRVYVRAQYWLTFEASAMAQQVEEGLKQQNPDWVSSSVDTTGKAPNVALAKVTDPSGKVLFISKGVASQSALESAELAEIPLVHGDHVNVFTLPGNRWEGVRALYTNNQLQGYAWLEFDKSAARDMLAGIQRDTLVFGMIWAGASVVLVLLLGRAITRPLAELHRGTTALMSSPEDAGVFPLPVKVHNEIGDVIETFNRMVASLGEQRSGLNDTLSLLDSMLANAPIGLAFVDRNRRFVRVNQVFADLTGMAVSRHLGRTLTELLPGPVADAMNGAVQRVFSTEGPVHNLELSGEGGKPGRPWSWLVSAYPVRTLPGQVRWAGIIVLDASDRKRSEEALRRTEKLAVTGRLAASIAHEINNPLEAITNLLFLLRNSNEMPDSAQKYLEMTENEVRRVSEITQQTLRFYRQPTQPARSSMAELLDSVISLYQSRLHALGMRVERDYDPALTLFCFAGEIRQVIANLIGNSIDASGPGGRLLVRARRSRDWMNARQAGVRIVVADTGTGMEREVRQHIFEAFFTTKEATGTGLGLWVSHEIILKHHGRMHVRSRAANGSYAQETGSGTVFQIFIPDDPSQSNGHIAEHV